jgi:aminopeptidase N
MCSFKDHDLLDEAVTFAFSKDVRAQDSFKAISYVWANPPGRNIAWTYVKEHWREIVEKFSGGHLFARFVSPASNFTTYQKAREIEEFFNKNKTKGVERTVAQAVEQIQSNAAWLERDSKRIEEFLNGF